MRLEDFDYSLPDGLIARFPANPRESARLLVYDRSQQKIEHKTVSQLVEILNSGDVLVVNNTRVIPARIMATGLEARPFEVLLLSPKGDNSEWQCLVRPGRKVRAAVTVVLADGTQATLTRLGDDFTIRFSAVKTQFFEWLATVGTPPVPPYLSRETQPSDWTEYQTVYARENGSVAAPTAGLHFTRELLERLKTKGVDVVETTLHVGYGTFAPLTEKTLQGDRLHAETYSVPQTTLARVERARAEEGRVVCVGTTSLRSLESVPVFGLSGSTSLFVKPGYPFRYATALMTNFHLPQTSLLVLVSAFMGHIAARSCYEEAIRNRYRFYSYGDAMLII